MMGMGVVGRSGSEIEKRSLGNTAGEGADGGREADRLFHGLEGSH